MGEVLEEGIYSEIINVLLGCSGRVKSNEMRCFVPHCSFSISLDFLSKLPSIAFVSKLFLINQYFASCYFCIRIDKFVSSSCFYWYCS